MNQWQYVIATLKTPSSTAAEINLYVIADGTTALPAMPTANCPFTGVTAAQASSTQRLFSCRLFPIQPNCSGTA